MNKRLLTAMAAYAALGIVAAFLLHGRVLLVVLILFGYFAVRTFIAEKIRQQAEAEPPAQPDPFRDEPFQDDSIPK
jgi:hypothetical protein